MLASNQVRTNSRRATCLSTTTARSHVAIQSNSCCSGHMMISCLTMKTGLLTKIAGTYFTICASKCTLNSTNQLTASEAAEAGLTWPKTSALMSRGCMQSFNLLALKLSILIANINRRPPRPWRPPSHGLKPALSWVEAACKISTS